MKKILSVLLILLLLAALAACLEEAPAPEEAAPPVEILVPEPEEVTPPIEPEVLEPEPAVVDISAPINIAEIIGRNFDDYQHLFGNVIDGQRSEPVTFDFTVNYVFDFGIVVGFNSNGGTLPEWIHTVYVQFREPENEGLMSFAEREGFLDYEKSQRFHFNGIGHESTQADVATAFPTEYFNRAYLRDLTIFGEYWLPATGPAIPTNTTVEVELLEPNGFSWLISQRQRNELGMIYWNDYFAITFEFGADGRVIDMLVFSDRR